LFAVQTAVLGFTLDETEQSSYSEDAHCII